MLNVSTRVSRKKIHFSRNKRRCQIKLEKFRADALVRPFYPDERGNKEGGGFIFDRIGGEMRAAMLRVKIDRGRSMADRWNKLTKEKRGRGGVNVGEQQVEEKSD